MEVIVHEGVRMVIEDDGQKSHPFECCGFMYGKEENGKRIITRADPVKLIILIRGSSSRGAASSLVQGRIARAPSG